MRLAVISHKECVPDSATGRYYTDGGFPMQIGAIAELFEETRVIVPIVHDGDLKGLTTVDGQGLSVVPLERLSGKNWRRKVRFPAWLVKNSRLIWNEVRRADAVHTPIPGDIGTIGMLFALFQRKPLFVRHCGNWFVQTTLAERFWKWSMETFAGGRNVMLATGGSENPPSEKNPQVRWIFSTSLRNDQLQNAKPKTLPAKGETLRLVIACRQENRKGTDVVMKSLPLIRESNRNVELSVIGDGSRLPELRRLACELGVEANVKFHGKVRQTEVTDLLKTAHIFCYPTSASEGFPKVVLEALASGLPVITTRVSVLPQLMGEGGGVLIEPDAAQLADAVVKLSKDEHAYDEMSAAAIATARRFTLEDWKDFIAEKLSEAWKPVFDRQAGQVLRCDGIASMKICILAGTLGRGGAERQLYFMLRALKREGVTVKLLCLTKGEAFEEQIRDLGIEVEWVGRSGNRLLRLYDIYKAVRAIDPDLIQSSHFYTNIYAGVVSKLMRIPSIGAIRNDVESELRANPIFGKLHLRLPDYLIANSRMGVDNAVANGISAHRLYLLANVVERAPEKSRTNSGFTFLFAGRLAPAKRPELFIRLAERLCDTMPDRNLRFLILGDGVLRRELEAKAATTRLPATRLSFLGERADVNEVFEEADALVLTSKFEGTPNVILEAMSHGMPVIATRVGGIGDVLTDERGILVDPSDFDGLTRAAEKLVADPELTRTLGVEGRKYVEASHSTESLGQSLVGIYSKILKRS